MAFVVNKFVRYLTKRHDARNARRHSFEPGLTGPVELTPCEQIPSVMLAFHLMESIDDEKRLLKLMRKVFEKNANVKNQYGQAGETLLYAACKKGLYLLVQFFVENGVNHEIVTPLGNAYHGLLKGVMADTMTLARFEEIAWYLSTQGCDINAVNHDKMSPFLCAVEQCCVPALKLFMALGCDVNVQGGPLSYHALHLACLKSRPDVVQCLLGLPSVHSDPVSDQGCTPLHTAVNEWTHMFYKRTNAESSHQPVRVKGHLQLMIMVEAFLLAGADPFSLSTKKSFNLAKTLLQVRKEETNKGRWCSVCSHQTTTKQHGSHDCHHSYIGCPCKLTSLLIGGEEEREQPPMGVERVSQYGNTAVPYTSQMLASVLLYSSHHHRYNKSGQLSDYQTQLCECVKFSVDMTDPYIDQLLQYFTQFLQAPYNTPLSLKVLTRSVIRVVLGEHWASLAELPVPLQIKDFIAMKVLV